MVDKKGAVVDTKEVWSIRRGLVDKKGVVVAYLKRLHINKMNAILYVF